VWDFLPNPINIRVFASAKWRYHMPRVKVRDLDLHYEVHGNPDGEPLVLLHGFLSTGRIFSPFLNQLGEIYQLFIPDWRGHGQTVNPREVIIHNELARDTKAFTAALGIERGHFCGHSSGGMHLLFLALEHPHLLQTLTLVSATYSFDDYLKTRVREAQAEDASDWIDSLTTLHGDIHGPGYAHKLVDLWVASVHRPDELPFTLDDLGEINCPTLILHGDRDRYFPLQVPVSMCQAIPNSELGILPNCGHLLPVEQSEMFLTALVDFLSRNPHRGD
jgi:pimeloyl-ACP methyl ester carboxylesterase